jgi:hypothetical protein
MEYGIFINLASIEYKLFSKKGISIKRYCTILVKKRRSCRFYLNLLIIINTIILIIKKKKNRNSYMLRSYKVERYLISCIIYSCPYHRVKVFSAILILCNRLLFLASVISDIEKSRLMFMLMQLRSLWNCKRRGG